MKLKSKDEVYKEYIENENDKRDKYLSSLNVKKILKLLNTKKKLSITDISNKIKVSYKNTFAHIKKLKFYEIINTEKQLNDLGQKVIITLRGKSEIVDCHHIKPIKQGGKSELNNYVGLCPNHHKLIHLRGYKIKKVNEKWIMRKR